MDVYFVLDRSVYGMRRSQSHIPAKGDHVILHDGKEYKVVHRVFDVTIVYIHIQPTTKGDADE